MKKQRWYDRDSVLSLAVSCMSNAQNESRQKCADLIIELAMKNGVVLPYDITSAVKYMFRRWYDKDELMLQAMEYLKYSNEQDRREIALKVIELLQNV